MKILYHSVSPLNKSSYGRCTYELVSRLLEKHEVDIYAWFGLNQSELTYPLGKHSRQVKIIGNPSAGSGEEQWNAHVEHMGSKYDLVIDHSDLWGNWQKLRKLKDCNWIWWVIGDHSPVPAPHRMIFGSKVFAKGIPMTEWFREELMKCPQIPNDKVGPTIPHGVDLEVFYPSPNPQINVPENDFFIISVVDNKGHRENLPEMIEGYAKFLKETNANAYFYIHAFPLSDSGYNLHNVCAVCEELYGVKLYGKIGFKEAQFQPDSFMRDLYSKADCQLMTIQGGSFELPLIEAGACACPSISTDCTAMPEVLGHGDRGLLVPAVAPIWQNLTSSRQFTVNPNDIAEALITYYENPQLRRKHARNMQHWIRKNATWDIVGNKWLAFLDDFELELKDKGRSSWSDYSERKKAAIFTKDFSSKGDARITLWPPYPGDNEKTAPVMDRQYEYAYTVKKFLEHNLRDKKVLDVGSAGSTLPPILATLGNQVTCIDVRDWPIKFPNLKFIKADILNSQTKLPKFDVITCISTAEHFGLGRFGDPIDINGDIKGISILKDHLKEKGLLILSVGYGRPTVSYPAHRVYDKSRFSRLTSGFKIIDKKYFAPLERIGLYRPCTEKETYSIDTKECYAIICCLLQKEKS